MPDIAAVGHGHGGRETGSGAVVEDVDRNALAIRARLICQLLRPRVLQANLVRMLLDGQMRDDVVVMEQLRQFRLSSIASSCRQ